MLPMTPRKILLSPLLHFFVLGAVIFGVFAVLDDTPDAPQPDAITLSAAGAERLADQFAATWNRPPTPEELDGLIRFWALEEAYVREALALGLDRDDAVIRQRLNMKMQFLAESGAASLTPDDATLQAYLDANPDRFMRPPALAFEQVLLPQGTVEEIVSLQAALEGGASPDTLGAPSLLPGYVPPSPSTVIDRTFGTGFADTLADLEPGRWLGPVPSGYGTHLVRVVERTGAVLPPLAEIRDRVEAEWRAARTKEMRDAFGQALLERYTVTLPAAIEVLEK